MKIINIFQKNRYLGYIIICMLGITFIFKDVLATNYAVFPEFPDNQNEEVNNYFDLTVTPGQEQTIFFNIKNMDDKDLPINLLMGNGYTTMYGSIEYGDVKDVSLKHPFKDISKIDSFTVVPPDTIAKIPFTIKVPEEPFDGIILGGIEILEDPNYDLVQEGQMGAVNIIRHIIPVKLRENDKKIDPELHLLKAFPDSVEGKNAILLNLQNSAPTIIDNFYVDAQITKKGSNKVLYKQKRKAMQMAPNSNFNYPIFLGTEPLKAGKYTAYVTASAQGGYEWDLEIDFEITKDEADKFNRLSTLELEEQTNWLLYGGIALGILILLIVLYMIIKKQKEKKQKESDLSRKKEKK